MQRNYNMKGNEFFSYATTVHPRPTPHPSDEVELDDQAPLALIICIALPVVIGFIILVLIFCFCRRKPASAALGPNVTNQNTAAYHRAPDNDGTPGLGGGGVGSYPMTTVSPPNPYNTALGGYHHPPGGPQPHMGPPAPQNMSQGYRMVHPGMAPSPIPGYPNQQVPVPPPPPHFGGVPASYPAPPPPPPPSTHQYPVFLPPPSHPHTHSLSHSSQASSIASATTVDPLVPSSPPQQHHHPHYLQQQQQQQHQQYIQQQQYYHHHHQQQQQQQQHLTHHQQLQMQSISGSGRDSPSLPINIIGGQFTLQQHPHYPPSSAPSPLVNPGVAVISSSTPIPELQQSADPENNMYTSITSSESANKITATVSSPSSPTEDTTKSPAFLRKPQGSQQDLGYSDEEEEEEE